jgi:hypothetical protein
MLKIEKIKEKCAFVVVKTKAKKWEMRDFFGLLGSTGGEPGNTAKERGRTLCISVRNEPAVRQFLLERRGRQA